MNIHFIGIGGIGLSALARFLKYTGHNVSGSDIKATPITNELQKEGINVNIPQSASAIISQDLVIYSAAVTPDNCEIMQALENNLKLLSRKEALPIILNNTKNFNTCAAHGKSTTTAMLSSILQSSALIGAISKEFDSNFRYINDTLAFEADESDESFILSNPYCSIVLNTEPEHMEYYEYDEKRFYDAYTKFLDLAELRVINGEDEFLAKYKGEAIRFYPSKDITNIEFILKDDEPYTKFTLKDMGDFEVWGFGNHIASNATAAILAANQVMDINIIRKNLKEKYKGIKKRFDVVFKTEDFVVIDDYAHHPTEIKVTMQSVKLYNELKGLNSTTVIWQPHKYSRTADNLEEFKKCFDGCDKLIILPVWSVAEKIQVIDFVHEFKHYNPIFASKVQNKNGMLEILKGDEVVDTICNGTVLGVGAGDITYQLR